MCNPVEPTEVAVRLGSEVRSGALKTDAVRRIDAGCRAVKIDHLPRGCAEVQLGSEIEVHATRGANVEAVDCNAAVVSRLIISPYKRPLADGFGIGACCETIVTAGRITRSIEYGSKKSPDRVSDTSANDPVVLVDYVRNGTGASAFLPTACDHCTDHGRRHGNEFVAIDRVGCKKNATQLGFNDPQPVAPPSQHAHRCAATFHRQRKRVCRAHRRCRAKRVAALHKRIDRATHLAAIG